MRWLHRHKERLFLLGRPLSPIYGAAMRWRRRLYDRGIFSTHRLPCPVISVGNITMGGTGKTPHVAALVQWCRSRGLGAGVVSRGYGGTVGKGPLLVADDTPPRICGDEPAMLRRMVGVEVAVGSRRAEAARLLLEHRSCDIIILDDGFQHLAVARSVDICLMDYHRPLGNGRVFPGGDLREPVSALARADVVILTRSPSLRAPIPSEIEELMEAPVFRSITTPGGLKTLDGRPCHAAPARVAAFCGIGDPGAFRATLEQVGLHPNPFIPFPDHHPYGAADVAGIEERARALGAEALVTTAKDAVKLEPSWFSMPLLILTVEVEVEEGFWQWIEEAVGRAMAASSPQERR